MMQSGWSLVLDMNTGKVKVYLSLFTPLRHIGGVEVLLYTFLTLVLDGGEWSKYAAAGEGTPVRVE
jgi:hypothetical protein